MKLWIPVNDMKICVQKVKRGKTIYFRFCPVTMFRPTPKQQAVRMTLAKGAYNAFGQEERDVVASVQEQFRNWVRSEPEHRSEVFKLLANYFPNNAAEVFDFLQQYS